MRKRISKPGASSTRLTHRIIQVPMDAGLLDAVDAAAGRIAESRAAYIRTACEERLRREASEVLDRRYMAAYRRRPEKPAWGKLGAKLLARRLRDDAP